MKFVWIVYLFLAPSFTSGVVQEPTNSNETLRTTPWIDLSDLGEWKQEAGTVGLVHRATTSLPDYSVIRLDSKKNSVTTMVHRPGFGHQPTSSIRQHPVLRGMMLDASSLAGDRIGVLFYDNVKTSPTHGCLVRWIGTLQDLLSSREGQYTVILGTTNSEIPIRGEIHRNLESNVFRVRADFNGELPRRFQSVLMMSELDARVPTPGYKRPLLDLDTHASGHVIVDREPGQYLGHPTTVLL